MDIDHSPALLQSCLVRQEKNKKVLKFGIVLLSISLTLIIATILTFVFYHNPKAKEWIKEKAHIRNRKQNRISTETIFSTGKSWYSASRQFVLALLPDVHVLQLAPEIQCKWRLGFHTSTLGKTPTLTFAASQGILELRNTQGFIIWTSDPWNSQDEKKRNHHLAQCQGVQYILELSDDTGELRIITTFKWNTEEQVIWSSHTSTPPFPSGHVMLPYNFALTPEYPLFDNTDHFQMLFVDTLGMLQIWKQEAGESTKATLVGQSDTSVLGEPPWTCFVTCIGVMVIMDRKRHIIWTTTFIDKDKLPVPPLTLKGSKTVCLRLSAEGCLQLSETPTSSPYWSTPTPNTFLDGKPKDASIEKKRSNRLCLIGQDFLLSGQFLFSISDNNLLQLQPVSSDPQLITSILFLDEQNARVKYRFFREPVSIFTDFTDLKTILSIKDGMDRTLLVNESYVLKDSDRPLMLYYKKNCLRLVTTSGQLIAKKNIRHLEEELSSVMGALLMFQK